MDHIICCLLVLGATVITAHKCPMYCECRNLSESLGTLCPSKGLLFVPSDIDRSTVELRLGGNYILCIMQQDFANMSDLVDLTLSRNTISYIQPFSFGDLEMLRSLHLDNNRLIELGPNDLRGLVNLQHLIINNNQLGRIHDKAFEDLALALEDLDLSYNNLMFLPWNSVQQMINLHQLSVDHNLLEFIPEGTFANLEKLARLDLTSNHLQKLPPDSAFARAQDPMILTALYAPQLSLSLGGNPLHCNCEMLWLRRLERLNELETCASPPALKGLYFWYVKEEDFVCQPPRIIQHTHRMLILEGQMATLSCEATGDPNPTIHWMSPDEQLLGNSSQITVFSNGTLSITIATSKDYGTFTCIASNVAGESSASVEVSIMQLPHLSNGTGKPEQQNSHLSDIANTTKISKTSKGRPEMTVSVSEVTTTTALVKWTMRKSVPRVKMYQLQYNCSDEVLIYRMIPASKKNFLLTNLVSGTRYDLCMLAAWDDTTTTVTATSAMGCTRFFTQDGYVQCQSLSSKLLGGSMILVVGGIIVTTLLAFIVILMVHHKAIDIEPSSGKLSILRDTLSQISVDRLWQNGVLVPRPQSQPQTEPQVKANVTLQNEVVEFKCDSLQSSLTSSSSSSSTSSSNSPNSTLPNILRLAPTKPLSNLDHLLGTITSLELRRPQGCDPRAFSSATMTTKLNQTLDSSLSQLLMLPLDPKPKRSQSFDSGDTMNTSASQLHSKSCRISSIWTKRRLSANGLLLQSEKEQDKGGSKGTLDSADWVLESTV
ncbi:leucine-rich repeat and fibronectin type-III domain-containing protein 2-like [Melanotaenia boesemani]|uniref:leucine-rich repeat and fibronectin type-III domain-containing protein 2-like n=1 Tax=Melanotaenia boesemani TaxID=1250792 RepID=UPI001C053C0E|nr:leucine-rich repeat and fibronectin type-III domain-containing protein 2-like [Melanotaenia boesemani]